MKTLLLIAIGVILLASHGSSLSVVDSLEELLKN